MTKSSNFKPVRMPNLKARIRSALLSLAVCCAGFFGSALTVQAESTASFIPANFEPPTLVQAEGFILKPLGPELVLVDYEAYMSSIKHLQTTFTRSTGWPHEGLDMDDAMVDMQNEERRFNNRESFAYAVLTKDEKTELGCVYVYPSSKVGHDAVIRLWVTQQQFDKGFDDELYQWTQTWVDTAWTFDSPAYPGRAISWDDWEQVANLN